MMLNIINKAVQFCLLLRLDKPIGILLLLWPVLWSLWLASNGRPDLDVLFVFVSGVICMRSAGCIINDYADRDFDGQVTRTKHRPLATGSVTKKQALWCFAMLIIVAFILVLQTNTLTILLSLPALLLAIIYPWMKRYTFWPQVVLGMAFGFGPLMAWSAQNNQLSSVSFLIFVTNIIWTLCYDTQYAIVDRDDDLKAGIKSTAILFGSYDLIIISSLQCLVIVGLLSIGYIMVLHWYYYFSVLLASMLFVYQYYCCKTRISKQCFNAFLNNNWVGACIFAGVFLDYGIHNSFEW